MKILIVEDIEEIREEIRDEIKKQGFDVLETGLGKEALRIIRLKRPEIIILDLQLPDINGKDICKIIRKKSDIYGEPIILMLTSSTEQKDVIKGLQIGADDYIKKPFNMQELILRVKRFSKNIVKEEIYNYKNIIIDIKKGNLYFEEKEVKTTIKEFEFILYLIKNRGIVLSREIIMETIWRRYYDIGDRSIDNCIKRLRKKIPILNESIESVRGYGYRLK